MSEETFGYISEELPFYYPDYAVGFLLKEGLATTLDRDRAIVDWLLVSRRLPDVLFPVYAPGVQTSAQSEALISLVDGWNTLHPRDPKRGFTVLASVDVGYEPFDNYASNTQGYLRTESEALGRGVLSPLRGDAPIHDTFAEIATFVELQRLVYNKIEDGTLFAKPYEKGLIIAMAPHVLGINLMLEALNAKDLITVVSAEGVLRATDYNSFLRLISDHEYLRLTGKFYEGELVKNAIRGYGGLPAMRALSKASSEAPKVKKTLHRLLHS